MTLMTFTIAIASILSAGLASRSGSWSNSRSGSWSNSHSGERYRHHHDYHHHPEHHYHEEAHHHHHHEEVAAPLHHKEGQYHFRKTPKMARIDVLAGHHEFDFLSGKYKLTGSYDLHAYVCAHGDHVYVSLERHGAEHTRTSKVLVPYTFGVARLARNKHSGRVNGLLYYLSADPKSAVVERGTVELSVQHHSLEIKIDGELFHSQQVQKYHDNENKHAFCFVPKRTFQSMAYPVLFESGSSRVEQFYESPNKACFSVDGNKGGYVQKVEYLWGGALRVSFYKSIYNKKQFVGEFAVMVADNILAVTLQAGQDVADKDPVYRGLFAVTERNLNHKC